MEVLTDNQVNGTDNTHPSRIIVLGQSEFEGQNLKYVSGCLQVLQFNADIDWAYLIGCLEGIAEKPIQYVTRIATRTAPVTEDWSEKDGAINVDALLSCLLEKSRDVIRRRFGLADIQKQTLEEIGMSLKLTRERIRQIESKALVKIRKRHSQQFKHYLITHRETILGQLSNESEVITAHAVTSARKRIAPAILFVITQGFESLPKWLDTAAFRVGTGWTQVCHSDEQLAEWATELRAAVEMALLPRPVLDIQKRSYVSPTAWRLAPLLLPSLKTYDGYAILENLTRRRVRAIHLHQLLSSAFSPHEPIHMESLVNCYRNAFPSDPAGERDFDIVLRRFPHLFLNLYEEGWAVLGQGAPTTRPFAARGALEELGVEEADEKELDESIRSASIKSTLRDILTKNGPLQFHDIRTTFQSNPEETNSRNSVGPVLIANSTEFLRLAPGVYGLRPHVGLVDSIHSVPALLLNERQIQLYCLARWAQEPRDLFPYWTTSTEMAWAIWARTHSNPSILRSLLAIADISKWPATVEQREYWSTLRDKHAHFELEAQHVPPLTETIPTARQLLNAACSAGSKRRLSWISANRTIGARVDDSHAGTILAILIALGVLEGVSHWQANHPYLLARSWVLEGLLDLAYTCDENVFEAKAKEFVMHSTIPLDQVTGWAAQQNLGALLTSFNGADTSEPLSTASQAGKEMHKEIDEVLKAFLRSRAERRVEDDSRFS